jgi:hypothetical protein
MEVASLAIRGRTRLSLAAAIVAWISLVSAPPTAFGQIFPAAKPSFPVTVSGTVVDALTGQPIGHALVKLGQRAMLTDSEGHFSFPRVDPVPTNASAMKPGYSFTQAPGDAQEISIPQESLADPLILRLYPEALLVGTVTDEDALPLKNVRVTALRGANEEDGHRWLAVGVAHTNARGQFRLGVPAGDYRVASEYLKLSPQKALLPAGLPASTGEPPLHIRSREQASTDLHPVTAALVEVLARADGESVRDLSQMNAVSQSGRRFPVAFSPTDSGEIQMSLPVGTYTLEVKHRSFGSEGSDLASINVTQPGTQPLPVTLHFAPVASVPIEIREDDASIAAANANLGRGQTAPTASTLGLTLEPLDGTASDNEPLRPIQRYTEASFVAPAGTYRLRARTNSGWYITSATAGGNDLLSHELLVAAGAASLPIQIVVSNQTATLKGNVKAGDQPAQAWIYLVATYPSATPLLTLHSGKDGTFSTTLLPPGSYNAIAFSHRNLFDPYDPDALANYTTRLTNVTVQAGEKASLDLELTPDAESKP